MQQFHLIIICCEFKKNISVLEFFLNKNNDIDEFFEENPEKNNEENNNDDNVDEQEK